MPRVQAPKAPSVPYPVGRCPIAVRTLVGVDGEGRLVPVDRAARFVGVSTEAHSGTGGSEGSVGVAESGTFPLGFRGWTPSFADVGRSVWAFSPTEVAGAPLRTSHVVGRVVGLATTPDGSAGVRVEIVVDPCGDHAARESIEMP